MITAPTWEPAMEEAPRQQWMRRIQQRRCLVCGSRQIVNQQTSYFCRSHHPTHRWCPTCATLRPVAAHGKDSRCRGCAAARALAAYYADPDRTIYRLRLRALARRQLTRGDQIFADLRKRIALADLVARTPGWTWRARAQLAGVRDAEHLAHVYRRQCAGLLQDGDACDRRRRAGYRVAGATPNDLRANSKDVGIRSQIIEIPS